MLRAGARAFAPLRLAPALSGALLLACLTLAGCGSAPKRGGGFYQDDGPPREVPRDLERTPDAVPRVEPFHPYANRPYTALGRRYTPITDDRPFRQRGLASWYGRQFHGNRTANGERYDMFGMTAAHPTLPLPSYVRVTAVKSGASVIVRVNDRGPFANDRVIDLSYAAATRLGFVGAGTAEVEVVRLTHADIRAGRFRSRAEAPYDGPEPAAAAPAPLPAPSDVAAVAGGGRWSVQLGAFELPANAQLMRERVQRALREADPSAAAGLRVQTDGEVHRVLVGALATREQAQQLATRLAELLGQPTSLFIER